ncbi:MAG: hypothetical protein M3418_06830, partial [Gemmatimonadota bacterium]|nr:hypothetical protein [Gemmatimonadota bacterium]
MKLIRLLAPHRLGADPPIPTVLDLVEERLSSFSEPFQEAFTNFRRAFIRSDARLGEYPFWSAVREAATAQVPGHARGGPAFQLFLESNVEWQDELVLVADAEPERALEGVTFVPTEISLGKYEYVVAAEGTDDAVGRAVRLLLHRVLERAVPDIRSSPVFVATDQGVLLFRRDETGVRELTSSRPDDDEVWALVRENLLPPFLAIFPLDRRPTAHPSPYSEWMAVSTFDGRLLRHFDHTRPGPLNGVRCLQPTVAGIQVRLSGGVPLQGAFLGLPLCLPVVKVRGADSVALFSLDANSVVPGALERLCLVPSVESDEIFTFPDDGDLVLDGRFNLIAKAGAHVIAQRQITFRSAMIWSGYSRPTDPERWMAEAMVPDVVVPIAGSEVPEVTSEPPTVGHRSRATARLGVAPSDQDQGRIPRRLVIPEGDQAPLDCEQEDEDGLRLDRFIECCAGWAANRKGIAEFDFLEWIGRGLSIEAYGLKFDIARAWTEGGFFDRFIQRRWRGRVYFARDPELVVWRSGSRVHGTLRGLAPRAVRNRVQASAEANGAQRRSTRSHSPWVPAPLSWSGESSDMFERVATETEIGPIRWLRPVSDFVAPVAAVTAQGGEVPMHYSVKGTWDWHQGRFTPGSRRGRSPVEVRWLWRSDRPAYYEILFNNESFWSSHSRNWALLVAHTIAGVAPFERVG